MSNASGFSIGWSEPRSNVGEPESPRDPSDRASDQGSHGRSPAWREQPPVRHDEQEQAHRKCEARQPTPAVDPRRRPTCRQRLRMGDQRSDRVGVRGGAYGPQESRRGESPRDRVLGLARRQEHAEAGHCQPDREIEKLSVRACVKVECKRPQEQRRRHAAQEPACSGPRPLSRGRRSRNPGARYSLRDTCSPTRVMRRA